MKQKTKKYLKLVVKLLITAIIIYIVLQKIKPEKIVEIFRRSNLVYLFAAMLLFALSKLIAAFRLNKFLRCIDVNISDIYNIKLYLLGMYYNLFLPGGIGGDGYKIYLLNKKSGTKISKLFWSLMLDRVSGLFALFCLTVIFSLFISFTFPLKNLVWLLIPIGIIVFFIVIHFFFRHYKKVFAVTNLLALMVQVSQLISAFFILKAIGIEIGYINYLFVFLISSIVAAIPFTIGGLGSREITFLFAADILHLDINASIALSLMFYVITAIVSFTGIYFSIKDRL